MNLLAAILVSYLIGSISFAVLVSRAFGLPDPHTYGSGNPGATNVLRAGKKAAAVLTLLGDAFKGWFAVMLVQQHLIAEPLAAGAAAVAVVLGHMVPVFHGFRGGKGVATSLGVLLALDPWLAAGAAGTSGVSAIQTVVLKGDPSKAGLYTLLLKVSQPNVRIQAHAHSDDRVATVIKGTWYFAYGDKFDEARLAALPPGSFYTEPPNVNHFAMTKGEVIIQITGTGPSTTKYVDPATDPAAKR